VNRPDARGAMLFRYLIKPVQKRDDAILLDQGCGVYGGQMVLFG